MRQNRTGSTQIITLFQNIKLWTKKKKTLKWAAILTRSHLKWLIISCTLCAIHSKILICLNDNFVIRMVLQQSLCSK